MQSFKLLLRHLEILPIRLGKLRRILAPSLCGLILAFHFDVFSPLGLNNPMSAVRGSDDEIGIVVPNVAQTVRVFNRESELLRQLCEGFNILCTFKESAEPILKLIVTGNVVEHTLLGFKDFPGIREGRSC